MRRTAVFPLYLCVCFGTALSLAESALDCKTQMETLAPEPSRLEAFVRRHSLDGFSDDRVRRALSSREKAQLKNDLKTIAALIVNGPAIQIAQLGAPLNIPRAKFLYLTADQKIEIEHVLESQGLDKAIEFVKTTYRPQLIAEYSWDWLRKIYNPIGVLMGVGYGIKKANEILDDHERERDAKRQREMDRIKAEINALSDE